MSFIAMILKNLFRQRVRTGLTLLGISIGITTVVALGVITGSFKTTAGEILQTGGSNFMVAQKGASDLSLSVVTETDLDELRSAPGVERASGVLIYITQLGVNPYFPVFGVDNDRLASSAGELISGSMIEPSTVDEIVIGSRAAGDLGVSPGDTITVDQRVFRVAGVFQSGNTFQDAGAYLPLALVQSMSSRPDSVTMAFVWVKPGSNQDAVAKNIESSFPRLTTVSSVSDYSKVDQGMELLDAANLAISILAVGLGAIGVMNTMVMSVFERTREIGILRAVGWSGQRIMRMIIGESLILCVLAAIVGLALGILAVQAVITIPAIKSFLEPQYTLAVFIRALVVAIGVALVGAAYPAFRAVRLTPMEALRHE